MKKRVAVTAVVAAWATIVSCHKTKTFTLPDRPAKASVAFVALFEGERAREVGPVVPYRRVYSGDYAVESGKTGLDARLFFVEEAALQAEARARCNDLTGAVEKVACRDRVSDCERDASSCLWVQLRGQGCGDRRLALSDALAMTEFRPDDSGNLKAAPEDSASREELELCGPSLAVSCPILLPGFVVTEDGLYRCTAPSRQRGCSLEVDLSVCGLGRATGDIAADGTFLPEVPIAGCASEALGAGEAISGGGGFAVQCESRRFVASNMMRLVGEKQCGRRGPTIYNNALVDNSGDGFVRGAKYARFPGWMPRLLFVGTGIDGCAERGCRLTNNCLECEPECRELITLPDCANANSWDPCTGVDVSMECEARCKASCDRQEPVLTCVSVLRGHGLSVAQIDQPEYAVKVTDLEDSTATIDSISALGALALVEHRGRSLVAVAGKKAVRLFAPAGPDDLQEIIPLTPPALDFDIAGMIERNGALAIFGRTSAAPSNAVVMPLTLSDENSPQIIYGAGVPLELPTADAAAVLGAGSSMVIASLDPPLGNGPAAVDKVSVVSGENVSTLQLPGAPTALGSISGGAALAGVKRSSGETTLEVLVADGASSARIAASIAVIEGLIPKVMLSDPKTCQNDGDPCITYVGFELTGANRDNGRAVVGIVQHDRGNPASAKLIPSFIETVSPELTLLVIDTERDVLYAIASAANRVTPIQLAR